MSENQAQSTEKGRPREEMVRPLAEPQQLPSVRPMTPEETGILDRIATAIHLPPRIDQQPVPSNNTGHSRENFDVRAMGQVTTKYGVQDLYIFGGITLGVVLFTWYVAQGDLLLYALVGFIAWGAISYFAFNRTRLQGWNHSPTGVARLASNNDVIKHDRAMEIEGLRIQAAAEVAKHAIDTTSATMLKRWQIERGKAGDQ